MAAHSNNFIRVRLHFEYPPPAVVDCRMCWLLVDLNRCRVVADLESVIREKFEFGRRSILSLFIEDCYLPHTESVYVVRDNDSVRVKVDHLAQVNGHSTSPLKEGSKKRLRPTEEDEPGDKPKKKKRKERNKESQETDAKQADGDDGSKKSHEKHKKKKKRKEVETVTPKKTPGSVTKPAKSPKKPPPASKPQEVSSSDSSSEEDKTQKKTAPQKPAPVKPPVKSTKKLPPKAKVQKASSSDSSSSEEEDKAPQKNAPQKPAPKASPAASKGPQSTKPAVKKLNPPSSTSSDSSSEEESLKKLPKKKLFPSGIPSKSKNNKPEQASSSLPTTNCATNPPVSTGLPPGGRDTSSDSEEEIQLVIRRPLHPSQQLGRGAGAPGRGRGWGRGSPADRERGRGGGRGGGRGQGNSFHFNYNGYKEPSTETDSLTNVSVVLQNGEKKAESVPKPDYNSMPLLAAPPLVGQKIAFKLLELTENYTPEVSEYKEGKIVKFDPTTKQVELELLHASQAPVEPGKFDLVYQNEDGSERVEYAVSRGSKVTERWDSLLEPRLIV